MDNHDIYDDNKDNKKEENEKDNGYKNYNKMKNYCNEIILNLFYLTQKIIYFILIMKIN